MVLSTSQILENWLSLSWASWKVYFGLQCRDISSVSTLFQPGSIVSSSLRFFRDERGFECISLRFSLYFVFPFNLQSELGSGSVRSSAFVQYPFAVQEQSIWSSSFLLALTEGADSLFMDGVIIICTRAFDWFISSRRIVC